ncbi:unnamed protein product [Auanema sp. JU1783]|nr:unnamed protein product [Auanema sp. JU1783]
MLKIVILLSACIYPLSAAAVLTNTLKASDNLLRPSPLGNFISADGLPKLDARITTKLADMTSIFRKTSPDLFQNKLKEINLPNPLTIQKRNTMNSILSLNRRKPDRFALYGDTPHEINSQYATAGLMYQGDMIIEDEVIDSIFEDTRSRQKRQAYTLYQPRTLWDTTIDYEIGNVSTAGRSAILKAISFWQNHTCIRFRERPTAVSRLHFFGGAGCFAGVGKPLDGGMQGISIGFGCEHVPIAAHEIAHALGFFHSQNRFDRDNQIIVNYDNILPTYFPNYLKLSSVENNNYGLPYDYGSGMHYDQYGFAKNGTVPTLVPTDPRYQNSMGQTMPSFIDVFMMNTMYSCQSKCSSSTNNCRNNGFPDPNNCNRCICPSGYGGTICTSPQPFYNPYSTPVSDHVAISTTTTITSSSVSLSGITPSIDSDYKVKNVWIRAPAGKKVELTITAFTGMNLCAISCSYGGLEVKVNADNRLSGIRNCCSDDVGKVLVSDGSTMVVTVYSRYGFYGVNFDHRSI